jgi:hypothetical protein
MDYEGRLIVNGLHNYYIPARFQGDISAAFNRYEAVVTDNLNAGLEQDCHAKWEWMLQYLRYAKQ